MRVLVLGAYGLIGAEVMRRLLVAGHDVVGLGRDVRRAKMSMPRVLWIAADIAKLTRAESWSGVLQDARAEVVVNCAGVLQDGAIDHVRAVQTDAMLALIGAAPAAGIKRFVQISAGRARSDASTEFMRTKAEADAALAASPLAWVIFKPGLVIAREAYGGTALLRALAALPLVQLVAHADSRVQTVSVDDVADAVLRAIEGRCAERQSFDLVEEKPQSMGALLVQMRAWMGLPLVPQLSCPAILVASVSKVADGLGRLGWRSPFRSTAVAELAAGVTGDPAPWRAELGRPLASFAETLERMPATVQERWFARAFLLKPIILAVLSAFWILTGLVALDQFDAASSVLTERGAGTGFASLCVFGGAMADIALGMAVLMKRWSRAAAVGMLVVSAGYLIGGTLLAPDLWLDPLGPLLKVIPAAVLAVVALAVEGDR